MGVTLNLYYFVGVILYGELMASFDEFINLVR